jgi:uncharacterized protein (UPF0332 family)
LGKATRSFHEAGLLLAGGDADFAVSRAYYGCFYVAEAPLFDEGSNVSTHAGVIGEYGRIFAKTERLDRDFHKLLNRAFRAWQSADYDLDFNLDDVEVRELIAEGEAFLDAATSYLERSNTEDIVGQD